jgi:hypothetical protein
MQEHQFEYKLLVKAIYTALLWMSLLINWIYPEHLLPYLLLMLFLGLGLRPLMEITGVVSFFQKIRYRLTESRVKEFREEKERQAQRKIRDDKYRRSRIRDKRLPKNG